MSDSLKQSIDARADWHLDNWAKWMGGYGYSAGYPGRAAGLECGGISGDDSFDHLCQDADSFAANVVDACIDSLDHRKRAAIFNVYCATVWRFRGTVEEVFVDAVEQFWRRAKANGLS